MTPRARRNMRTQPSPKALDTGAALAQAWARARVFADGALCQCAGGTHVAIDPQAVAADVLFYLVDKYRGDQRDGLASFVAAAPAQDFDGWLERLDAAPLGAGDRAALVRDLANTIESMQAPAGFMCV